jgi:hypothetical protein
VVKRLDKGVYVAADTAGEVVKRVGFAADGERWCFFLLERGERPVFSVLLLKVRVLGEKFQNVYGSDQFFELQTLTSFKNQNGS